MKWLFGWLFDWFYRLLYSLQKNVCYIVDFIREVFLKLSGIEKINIDGKQSDLLSFFISSTKIKNAFWCVLLIGTILLFLFVLIAIIKSGADEQNKKSKGKIIYQALRSFLMFLLVPFVLIAGIAITNAVMNGINLSMAGNFSAMGAGGSLGGQILVTSGYNAYIGNASERVAIEQMFISGQLDYTDLSAVQKYYSLSDINYFVGIVSSVIILIMFTLSVITFVQRIFDVVFLFILSPVSVSTIPLDDGQRFKLWREMLISKVLSGYGIVLAMNLFFLIIPKISEIRFFDNNFKNGIIQLLFIIGGAFAVTKSNLVVAQLTGNTAGGQETQQLIANIRTSLHITRSAAVTAGASIGAVLGGTDFLSNRKKGISFSDNVASSIHSQRNRHIKRNDTDNSAGVIKKLSKGTLRLATLPAGILKDLLQGGVITAGKNFIPRVKNVISGNSIVNHADYSEIGTPGKKSRTNSRGDKLR